MIVPNSMVLRTAIVPKRQRIGLPLNTAGKTWRLGDVLIQHI